MINYIKIAKKYIGLIIIILVLVIGGFLFFNKRNNKAVLDFSNSYKKFDSAISDYAIAIAAASFTENPNFVEFDKTYSQIEDSIINRIPDHERLELSKKALLIINELIFYLNETNHLEVQAKNMLMELNIKALSIKNIELRNNAIEITNLCKEELDKLNDLKNIILSQREFAAELLRDIIDDNGNFNSFVNSFIQKDNQARIQNEDNDFNILIKSFEDINNRAIIYARFKGLAGIKD